MNLAYIAGFFDGEGHIAPPFGRTTWRSKYGQGSAAAISFAQSKTRGFCVLDEIGSFLVTNLGISKYRITEVRKAGVHNCWQLTVTGRENITKVLQALMPYLRVKRAEAQDLLRFFALYPSLRPFIWQFRRENLRTSKQSTENKE